MSYIDNEILERLIGTMVEGFARIEKKLDQMNRLKECMNGDRLLDNVDLAELLGVSHLFPFRTEKLSPLAPMVLQCNAGE